MMKTLLTSLCILALTSQYALATVAQQGQDQNLEWEVVRKFNIGSKPVDIAHSLDGKYAFVLTDKNVIRVYDQAGALQGSIPVEKGVNAIAIDPMGQYLHLSDSSSNTFHTLALDFVIKINSAKAPTKGDINAPVTIAVFSDFQWPYCGKIAPLLEQVLNKNEGKVKIVFKNLPLKIHDLAQPAALAALAAGKQDKFWEYHDKLFAEKKIEQPDFERIAMEIDLDFEKFKEDMKSKELVNHLRSDMVEAQKNGITGTPTIFINGRKLKKRTLSGFQRLIDEEMKKVNK